jgi:hypothetical protein
MANSCWDCAKQQIGGMTFLGKCKAMAEVDRPFRDITPEEVDAGCSYFEPREDKNEPAKG